MFWTRLFSKAGLGRVLGGFGKDLGWILKVADHIVDSYFVPCWDKLLTLSLLRESNSD